MSDTVATWLARGDTITAYCGNHKCARNRRRKPGDPDVPNGKEMDLSKLDPNLTALHLRDRLKCDVCGERKGTIRINPTMAPGAGKTPGLR